MRSALTLPRTAALLICSVGGAWPVLGAEQAQIELPIAGLFRATYTGGRTVSIPRFDPSLGTLESVTLIYSPEFSGTVSGVASGPPNAPNGWAVEFSGTVRLVAPGFTPIDNPHFETRSGLVYQPGTPVFQVFGPRALSAGPLTIVDGLTAYIGTANVSATLSWPVFTAYIFWSNGGTSATVTRDLGAVGGSVIYRYTPNPSDCNGDGAIDATDFIGFPNCLLGPDSSAGGGCECYALDDDDDVDLRDFSAFQLNFDGG